MRRAYSFLLMFFFLLPMTTLAQQLRAVIKEFSGKVEVKQPGQDWQPVQLNMIVPQGAVVSTGFTSWLVLQLGQTEITIRPLTRMLLRELIKKDSTNVTSLTLRVGKVNAVVRAASGEKNDFTVKGPVATAAVRGTALSFDVNIKDQAQCLGKYFYLVSNITGQEIIMGPGMFGAVGDNGRLILSDQIITQHSSTGWTPSDLIWWASQNESGFTLSTYTNNLMMPNVLPAATGIATMTMTVTVN